jgi:hypothetical protein
MFFSFLHIEWIVEIVFGYGYSPKPITDSQLFSSYPEKNTTKLKDE